MYMYFMKFNKYKKYSIDQNICFYLFFFNIYVNNSKYMIFNFLYY